MSQNQQRRRSLFDEKDESPAYWQNVVQEMQLLPQLFEELTPESSIEIQKVNLSASKQKFLSSLPNLDDYKSSATKFLNQFDVWVIECRSIKEELTKVRTSLL